MSIQSWIKYLTSLPNCNHTVTEKPLTVTFNHPGLTYCSFDRNYHVGISHLMNLVVEVRLIATRHTYDKQSPMYNLNSLFKDGLTFVLSSEFSMSRALYDKTVPKWPLKAKMYLGHFGNSTLFLPVELYAPGISEPLVIQRNQILTVDKETRRPKLLPENFRNQYKDQCAMSQGFRVDTFKRPDNTFMYKRKVMWLDTDSNGHTNYGSYVKFALDGLHAAIKSEEQNANVSHNPEVNSPEVKSVATSTNSTQAGLTIVTDTFIQGGIALKGICEEIIQAGMKNVKACYLNESEDGDVLDIHLWQEEGEGLIVRSSVEKDSTLICQMVLEYFSPLSKL